MRNSILGILACLAAGVACFPNNPSAVPAPTREVAAGSDHQEEAAASAEAKAAIHRLIAKYAQSVDTADVKLAAELWSNEGDVSFIHPRGHEHGWEAVRVNLYGKTMAEPFSVRKLSVRDISIRVYGDAAWADFYWDFVAKFRSDGKPLKTQGRETQVYRKGSRGWEIVHVHYSGMPVTGKREGS
jgi:ketosteroid isomerase-like protein